MSRYLLFGTERYALPILQPLADALLRAGHEVHAWLAAGAAGARLAGKVMPVADARAAVALRPRAG
ncbi:MAG TPA: CDP-glycerol glycerophosphotransferase, partial [Xanthomonadaceae bacterium]|nr:CDP-glycerol glycerophosphotransferase [Xanthomonadaceae bacterium]